MSNADEIKKLKAPKGCLVGCFSFIIILVIITVLVSIFANTNSDTVNQNIEPVLFVEQFALVNKSAVKEQLGEPESFEDIDFQTPSTGANNLLTYFYYNWNGYYSEFAFDDKDRLIRISIYPSDNDESKFVKTTFEDHLKQLGITPSDRLTKVEDTGYAWRYQSVSDKVDEVWTMGDENGIDVIKISFDVRPFL